MTIDFSKEEIEAIVGLMDAGVKAIGLRAVRPEVVSALEKISEAVKPETETA